MRLRDDLSELAKQLALTPDAIDEAVRRGLLSFATRRNCQCWRFGDSRNASFRRLDGESFHINGELVKAESETCGDSWHCLIGIDDVVANDRHDVLLTPEGSKDALAALHFADAEGTLSHVGVVAALGTGIKLLAEDVQVFRRRRVRIIADADQSGVQTAACLGERLAPVAREVQIFDLAGLNRDDGSRVKDLFDLTRIDYDDFEKNRDLWSITDLNARSQRVRSLSANAEFFSFPLSPPHGSPESHGFPVYPVSNAQELAKELEELAVLNACIECDTARKRLWQLARDVRAVEKRIARKLNPDELMRIFNKWYGASKTHLDPKKTRDHYCRSFLAGPAKVRVPTGESEALKTALARIAASPLPEIPGRPDAPESWRKLAAFHRELASQSANGTYFLGCRDAAKAHPDLNKDSANEINRALAQLGVIKIVRNGEARPGGNASEFRYLLRT